MRPNEGSQPSLLHAAPASRDSLHAKPHPRPQRLRRALLAIRSRPDVHADPRHAQPTTLIDNELQHTSSGTSIEPAPTPMEMLMHQAGGWTLMLHGVAFAADTQQQAANDRGADKLFSTNWIMPMAQHRAGGAWAAYGCGAMLSLEPAMITGRFYPEVLPAGRDGLWQAHRRWAASARPRSWSWVRFTTCARPRTRC